MAGNKRDGILDRLQRHDFHDDALLAMRIVPAQNRRERPRIELELTEYDTGRPRQLVFTGCENIRFDGDFAVLTDNAFAVVAEVVATATDDDVIALLKDQKSRLNVEYQDDNDNPIEERHRQKKLDDPSDLILFTVVLYGGTVEVAARNFKLLRGASNTAPSARP